MKSQNRAKWSVSLSLALFLSGFAQLAAGNMTDKPAAAQPLDLRELLQRAIGFETQAVAGYQKMVKKALDDGYPRLAALFAAVARSSQVTRENLMAVWKHTGSSLPALPPVDIMIQSSPENLKNMVSQALEWVNGALENGLQLSRQKVDLDALQAFNYAKSALTSHLVFLQGAAADLKGWEKRNHDFYVCSVCGYVVSKIDFDTCPICFNPRSVYNKISDKEK